jgi:hypothetical protein
MLKPPLPRSSPVFDDALSQVELALEGVRSCLVQGQAGELEAACQSLQRGLLQCSRLDPQWIKPVQADAEMRNRLHKVRAGVALVRENLARRAAAVQFSLQTLLPSAAGATYGRQPAAFGRSSRTAASFTSLSA